MTDLRPRRPEEGWLTVGLLAVMVIVMSTAVDDPAWVNGRGNLTDGLVYLGLLGLAVGILGPKVGWGRWTTHMIGALLAGLLIPIFAGMAMQEGASVGQAFAAAADGTVQAYLDLAWRNRQFTSEEVHYVVALGIVVWGTAQFAGYAVFGHRRPLNAVIMTAVVLLANMSMTFREELPYIVVFTGASLFLLIEVHAFDERATWIRRRIGDPSTISSLYLRGGTVFILAAMLGSLVMTARAHSDPLSGAWDGVHDQLIEVGQTIGRLLPVGGDARGQGVMFGTSARIADRWFNDSGVAFTAVLPKDEKDKNLYWRAAAYNKFLLTGWDMTDRRELDVAAGSPLLEGTSDDPDPDLTRPIQVTVSPDGFAGPEMLSAGSPVEVDQTSTVRVVGKRGWFGSVVLPVGASSYTVDAQLPVYDDDHITGNKLAVASTNYPPEVKDLYTEVPTDAMGPDAEELLARVKERAASDSPYDLARAMVALLGNPSEFHYRTDVTDQNCTSESDVECFARNKVGYCLHYASTMAILMRAANPDNPIPTRLVLGFLPGNRVGNVETVENRGAHAWVEVYFTGYGWIPFDPTGPGVGRASEIQPGPSVTAVPSSSSGTGGRDIPDFTRPPLAGPVSPLPPGTGGGTGDRTIFAVLVALVAVVIGGLAFAAWMRGPRGEISPERAWMSMSKVASRLGFGPRANQTVYEYAASLSQLVPVAASDLSTVADAKVETAYARARLGGDRMKAVGDASRRLRLSLLRLALRRGRRKGRR